MYTVTPLFNIQLSNSTPRSIISYSRNSLSVPRSPSKKLIWPNIFVAAKCFLSTHGQYTFMSDTISTTLFLQISSEMSLNWTLLLIKYFCISISSVGASKIINATPVISDHMQKTLAKVFPYLSIPVLNCTGPLNWKIVNIEQFHTLNTSNISRGK